MKLPAAVRDCDDKGHTVQSRLERMDLSAAIRQSMIQDGANEGYAETVINNMWGFLELAARVPTIAIPGPISPAMQVQLDNLRGAFTEYRQRLILERLRVEKWRCGGSTPSSNKNFAAPRASLAVRQVLYDRTDK